VSTKSEHGQIWGALLGREVRANARLYFRIAHRILHDAAAAQDVCQQAFLRACEGKFANSRGAGRLKSWLAKVVINESLQVRRRRKVHWRFQQDAARRSVPFEEPDRGPFLRAEVEAALSRLPELTRAVVVLRIMQGMPGKEVQALLGCSASEVSRRLYFGMEQLRAVLRTHADSA
jgi:RNA polymerase sigma-70 factor (ECF subfamily)